MGNFKVSKEIQETNRYDFVVVAETQEEANQKVDAFVETNCPYPFQSVAIDGVMCVDREAGM